MSNPDKAAAQEDQGTKPGFAETVNEVLNKATKDDKGNLILPDDLPEEVKYAANAEKRRRDTQSGYTQLAQRNKALEAEKAILLVTATKAAKLTLTAEQTEHLEELKFSDPEAWRKEVNKLEVQAQAKQREDIDNELKQVSTSSLESEELERRKQVTIEFNRTHPDKPITNDLVENDIPPRIKKKLETGVISFEDFLQECYEYAKTGKVIKQDKLDDENALNLSKVGGGSRPDGNALKEDIILSYNKETY